MKCFDVEILWDFFLAVLEMLGESPVLRAVACGWIIFHARNLPRSRSEPLAHHRLQHGRAGQAAGQCRG